MNFKDKELLLFDFDGTLINSIPDLALSINKMLLHYNLPKINIEDVASYIGNGAKTLVHRSIEKSMENQEISEEFFNEAFQFYLSIYGENVCEKTYTYPNVIETLDYLQEKAYKMVICTNKPFDFIEPILAQLDMKKYFELWIGENSLPEKKPNAAPLLYLAEKMNVQIENCVMIGDSKNDILAAQNARMDNIGVTYGYNYNENISDYHPTIVVDDFAELQKIF